MDLRDAKEVTETAEEKSQRNREAIKARMMKLGAILQEDSFSGLLDMIGSLVGEANAGHLSEALMNTASSMVGRTAAPPSPWRVEPLGVRTAAVNPDDTAIGTRMGWAYAASSLAHLKGWELPIEVYADIMGGELEGLAILTALYQSESLEEALAEVRGEK